MNYLKDLIDNDIVLTTKDIAPITKHDDVLLQITTTWFYNIRQVPVITKYENNVIVICGCCYNSRLSGPNTIHDRN